MFHLERLADLRIEVHPIPEQAPPVQEDHGKLHIATGVSHEARIRVGHVESVVRCRVDVRGGETGLLPGLGQLGFADLLALGGLDVIADESATTQEFDRWRGSIRITEHSRRYEQTLVIPNFTLDETGLRPDVGVAVEAVLLVDFGRPPIIEEVAMEVPHAPGNVQPDGVPEERARVFLPGHDPGVASAHAELPPKPPLGVVAAHPVAHLEHVAHVDNRILVRYTRRQKSRRVRARGLQACRPGPLTRRCILDVAVCRVTSFSESVLNESSFCAAQRRLLARRRTPVIVVDTQPTLVGPAFTACPPSGFEFGWDSVSGTSYKAQRARNPGASDWTEIGALTGTGGKVTFTDSPAPVGTAFYRVVVP